MEDSACECNNMSIKGNGRLRGKYTKKSQSISRQVGLISNSILVRYTNVKECIICYQLYHQTSRTSSEKLLCTVSRVCRHFSSIHIYVFCEVAASSGCSNYNRRSGDVQ